MTAKALSEVRAIETHWKGYRFRSRIEARWAVFFEAMGWDWIYEAEGYEANGVRYLPDFFVRSAPAGAAFHAEVKGGDISAKDIRRYAEFIGEGRPIGLLLLLGDIPEPKPGTWCHPALAGGLTPGYVTFWRTGPVALLPSCALTSAFMLETCDFRDDGAAVASPAFVPTPWVSRKCITSYAAARAARFEHGEEP